MQVIGRDATQQVLDLLTGREGRYHCPDLATVEQHITTAVARIRRAGPHAPRTVARLWADVDALLDRWTYLRHIES